VEQQAHVQSLIALAQRQQTPQPLLTVVTRTAAGDLARTTADISELRPVTVDHGSVPPHTHHRPTDPVPLTSGDDTASVTDDASVDNHTASLDHRANIPLSVSARLEAADVSSSHGLEAADQPRSSSLEAADVSSSHGLEAADQPRSSSLEAVDVSRSSSLEAADVSNSHGLEATDQPRSSSLEAADQPCPRTDHQDPRVVVGHRTNTCEHVDDVLTLPATDISLVSSNDSVLESSGGTDGARSVFCDER